mmetsp:Transcript_14504/g.36441  ORF Transcript_14504/g.36441 Transcript_14504/m.36441 type:complete len:234 (-) Transcript_14504:496-1197(-)
MLPLPFESFDESELSSFSSSCVVSSLDAFALFGCESATSSSSEPPASTTSFSSFLTTVIAAASAAFFESFRFREGRVDGVSTTTAESSSSSEFLSSPESSSFAASSPAEVPEFGSSSAAVIDSFLSPLLSTISSSFSEDVDLASLSIPSVPPVVLLNPSASLLDLLVLSVSSEVSVLVMVDTASSFVRAGLSPFPSSFAADFVDFGAKKSVIGAVFALAAALESLEGFGSLFF